MEEQEYLQEQIKNIQHAFDLLGVEKFDEDGLFSPLGRLKKYMERNILRLHSYGHFLANDFVVIEAVDEPARGELLKFLSDRVFTNDEGYLCCYSNDFQGFLLTWSGKI